MVTALLSLLLTQAPPMPPMPGKQLAPTAYETAQLYFISGDLPASREWAKRGEKREAAKCKPFLKTLAEYAYLMGKYEELTVDEAKQVLALDAKLSPKERGKLTRPVFDRHVAGPLQRAKLWAEQGAASEAIGFVDGALAVDPNNADAKALKKLLLSLGDGGVLDAGR